jgi:hypothetical protein
MRSKLATVLSIEFSPEAFSDFTGTSPHSSAEINKSGGTGRKLPAIQPAIGGIIAPAGPAPHR